MVFEIKNGIEEEEEKEKGAGNGVGLVVKRTRERDKALVIKEQAMGDKNKSARN